MFELARPRKLLLWFVAATQAFGGCSYLFATAPPANHERLNYFDCTSSNALPIVDTTLGAIYGLATAAALSGRSSSQSPSSTLGTVGAPLVLAAVFAASAVSGFGKTDDCRVARAKLMARLDGMKAEQPYAATPTSDPWLTLGAGLAPPKALLPIPAVPAPEPAASPAPPAATVTPPPTPAAASPTHPQETPTW